MAECGSCYADVNHELLTDGRCPSCRGDEPAGSDWSESRLLAAWGAPVTAAVCGDAAPLPSIEGPILCTLTAGHQDPHRNAGHSWDRPVVWSGGAMGRA